MVSALWPKLTSLKWVSTGRRRSRKKGVAMGSAGTRFPSPCLAMAARACLSIPARPPIKSQLKTTINKLNTQVHCLFAGVDHVLFPELVNGPVPLSNARGLFSSSLAEASILVRVGGKAKPARLT